MTLDSLYTHFTGCRRIVERLPGQSTDGADDRFVCADGTVWVREPWGHNPSISTVAPMRGYLHGGTICNHR